MKDNSIKAGELRKGDIMKYIVVLFALMAIGCEEKKPTLNDVTSSGDVTYHMQGSDGKSYRVDENNVFTPIEPQPVRHIELTGFTVTNGDTSWHYTYK